MSDNLTPLTLLRYDPGEHAAWVRPAFEGPEACVQPGVVVQGLFREQQRQELLHNKLSQACRREDGGYIA